jgi:hypothetical protein
MDLFIIYYTYEWRRWEWRGNGRAVFVGKYFKALCVVFKVMALPLPGHRMTRGGCWR